MTRQELDILVEKYKDEFDPHGYEKYIADTQYDDRSALLNYCFVREYKPKVVVEFGTRYGRCTFDIMTGLLKNGQDFTYKAYELEEGNRKAAQESLDKAFSDAPVIGGDIMEATDIPQDIEYLFIDNYHDEKTTRWVFDTLLPKYCKDGCLVQIHDLPIQGKDWKPKDRTFLAETTYMYQLHIENKLPLKKVYWTWEEGERWESTWWIYQKSQS